MAIKIKKGNVVFDRLNENIFRVYGKRNPLKNKPDYVELYDRFEENTAAEYNCEIATDKQKLTFINAKIKELLKLL